MDEEVLDSRGGPKDIEENLLAFYDRTRSIEREKVGEDFRFGPGYVTCIRDYYDSGSVNESNLIFNLAKKLNVCQDVIVPIMAGSCSNNGYLEKEAADGKIVPISGDLDLVIFDNTEQANAFKKVAPIILPSSSTQEVIKAIEQDVWEMPKRDTTQKEINRQRRELVRTTIIEKFNLPEHILLHLGSDELIKAVFRCFKPQEGSSRVFIPVPNYFDALRFAADNGIQVFPSIESTKIDVNEWIAQITTLRPDFIYISNPNNPLGYRLAKDELERLIAAAPEDAKFIIDEVGLDITAEQSFMQTDWKYLAVKFPKHHLIILDSFSKSHNLVTARLGVAIATHPNDQQMLAKYEPPCFSSSVLEELNQVFSNEIVEATNAKIKIFYKKLMKIIETAAGKIMISNNINNFCTIFFEDTKQQAAFLENISRIDTSKIPTKSIVGLPQKGGGSLESSNGSLDVYKSSQKGIIGLPSNAVRISALSHPSIIDALVKSLV
jgi:histidinol-phosphate/aromatic aminotransferase/cobyric acid decarboxylase-like protein